jgi:hypothetical protein
MPPRRWGKIVQCLPEKAVPMHHGDDNRLYRAACEMEKDERLAAEMAEWDVTVADVLASETVTAQPE